MISTYSLAGTNSILVAARALRNRAPVSAFAAVLLFITPSILANTYAPNTLTDPVINTLNNATGQINGGTVISLRSALRAADNLGGTHTVNLSTVFFNNQIEGADNLGGTTRSTCRPVPMI